ncbi:Cell surface [Micractinium conductrix]|uniref:Cell surface n=1 Tax=Micractinium conductrix TaxID=554055 RepID=A0A2P6VKA3_9CHLO|nr:Cell surface [Micractinium conductrix]|eukprot:PSC74536.1 Cell surface [Micractinium conductrix]
MRPPALLVALALLALSVGAHARLLQEEPPQQQQCRPGKDKWDYYSCYAATPPCLTTQWGGDPQVPAHPSAANCTKIKDKDDYNPFVPKESAGGRDVIPPLVQSAQGASVSGGRTLGYRTGGAQDVQNFRENIKQGYLPLPTDITFEGLVKDYFFDTSNPNATKPCTELFCPAYLLGVSPDPLVTSAKGGGTAEPEVYLAVGLDSGIKESEFRRKRLQLVVVLDVSGSMGSPFDQYYYDALGQQKNLTAAEMNVTKMDVAKEVLKGIVGQLAPDDIFSVVLFSDDACAPKRMGPLRCADVDTLFKQESVDSDIPSSGTSGTALSAGLDLAMQELAACSQCQRGNPDDVETRIMLISDEQPNIGDYTTEGLGARLKKMVNNGTYITIIGVGLDFNTELVEAISKVRGTLYFSVHSPGEFKKRLVQDFDYAVTPLVFDLSLAVDSASLATGGDTGGWKILHVYGSPMPNDTALSSDGTVMKIQTLFPSPKTDQGVKGGVVLLRMRPPTAGAASRPLALTVAYSDRTGKSFSTQRAVELPAGLAAAAAGGGGAGFLTYYQSSGVRKAVLLARYADMLQGWLVDEWAAIDKSKTVLVNATLCAAFPSEFCPAVQAASAYKVEKASNGTCSLGRWLPPGACALPVPVPVMIQLGQWERQSKNLTVNADARQAFPAFLPYLESETKAVGDTTLKQEADLLRKLVAKEAAADEAAAAEVANKEQL